MKRMVMFLCLAFSVQILFAQVRTVKLRLIQTTDIHGNYFAYDFANRTVAKGGLVRVSSYVNALRKVYHNNVLLFDNGDILQGQPTSYYYDYIDTTSIHLCASMMNEMKYDVGNLGNHDVETGIRVFTRWAKQCDFSVLCANAVMNDNGQPYFEPYRVFVRSGIKIAVLGMITPAIPCWLSEDVYRGLHFDNMEQTAKKWIKIIKERENPDIIVGLFHAGIDARTMAGKYREDASEEVAEHVPGFDIVMAGHDHRQYCKWIRNVEGKSVLIINPGKSGEKVGEVDLEIEKDRKGKICDKRLSGQLISMMSVEVDRHLMKDFSAQYDTVFQFVSHKLGTLDHTIFIRPAFFGPSAFVDAIHTIQLRVTGADISFAAPFSEYAEIKKGDFLVGDLFNLYRYENKLYVMHLSGTEVKNYLEESYSRWFNEMHSVNDPLFLLNTVQNRTSFKNPLFNFDSAAGIIYTVDVTKPYGQKIHIMSMADGTPFFMNRIYEVVLNSYRGNGGGELLTRGAGIPQDMLKNRIIFSSNKEMRYYIMKYIEKNGTSLFRPLNQWKVIPRKWVDVAAKRDSLLLFGK